MIAIMPGRASQKLAATCHHAPEACACAADTHTVVLTSHHATHAAHAHLALVQLVLINISDHCMRARMASNTRFPRVVGCLLGSHTGRTVDVSNSFELLEVSWPDGSTVFDQDVYATKLEQYQEVFKSLELIGWYATGTGVQASDLSLHKKMAEQVEAPIFLTLDPQATMAVGAKELPIVLCESGAPPPLLACVRRCRLHARATGCSYLA
jgi:JAB1/Mov34/MPN/PAD-1 ubiquitin protease